MNALNVSSFRRRRRLRVFAPKHTHARRIPTTRARSTATCHAQQLRLAATNLNCARLENLRNSPRDVLTRAFRAATLSLRFPSDAASIMTAARTSAGRLPGLNVLLALSLVLQVASTTTASSSKLIPGAEATISRELPLRTIQIGPTRPLRATDAATTDRGGENGASARFTPLVSARSVMLRNNITISQSRLVLSRLDQLFLLQRLVDLVDLAPKLTDTAAMEASEHAANVAEMAPLDEDSTAQGFLFDLGARTDLASDDADVAIVDVGGAKIGFGWRYPLAYWTKLNAREKPKCSVGIIVGRFYYC